MNGIFLSIIDSSRCYFLSMVLCKLRLSINGMLSTESNGSIDLEIYIISFIPKYFKVLMVISRASKASAIFKSTT